MNHSKKTTLGQPAVGDPGVAGGQGGIRGSVLQQDLCTGCGACVDLCPYLKNHKDAIIAIHDCNQGAGRCHDYCPRTPTDLAELARALFDPKDITPEIGAFKGLFMTRATDPAIRSRAQHGGTVTALMTLALDQGIVEAAILSDPGSRLLPEGSAVADAASVSAYSKSSFVVSPNLAAFNRASRGSTQTFGIVATPCQALAIAKMKHHAPEADRERVEKLRLVIGLFCGWALDWRKLTRLLAGKVAADRIRGIDIPPSSRACMVVSTDGGPLEIPIDAVNACVRENCRYCCDMTCEFSDIAVGSARSPEGWDVDRHWNQVIVRSALGERLLALAREKGVLEFKAVPPGNVEKLKTAAVKKKHACMKNLTEKSGNEQDLIYLQPDDPMLGGPEDRQHRSLQRLEDRQGRNWAGKGGL